MLMDGISILGSYHQINQDSFLCKKTKNNAYVLAVSDGLGSKKHSDIGSKMLCESIILCTEACQNIEEIKGQELVKCIHNKWKEKLSSYNLKECYATMLFLIYVGHRLLAVRLGDGFIALQADEIKKVLYDKKEEYFANETDALTETLNFNKIKIYEMDVEDTFYGAIICTDGIDIVEPSEERLIQFTDDLIEEYRVKTSTQEINEDIKKWLSNWTGGDDKTLAYLIAKTR